MTKDSNPLASRMKAYEAASESNIDRTLPYMIRLDGHCFSKFTKQFRKPFDVRIHNAMAMATADLVKYFDCTTGYTQSDEITLIFPAPVTEQDLSREAEHPDQPLKAMPFNGRIQKIVSLAAGYCSVRFNFHLQSQPIYDDDSELLKSKLSGMVGFFDARVFSVDKEAELLNNIIWRSCFDCERNSTAMLAQAHYSAKQLHGLSRVEQREKLMEKGIDWNDQPNWFKHGALIKKEQYEKECTNPKTGEVVLATRSRLVLKSFPLRTFEPTLLAIITAKYWGEELNEFLATQTSDFPVESRVLEE